LIRWLVERRATVAMAVLCTFVVGLMTYGSLPREASPDVDVPFVMVTTPYIGVSPEDVESLVTIPLENELTGIKDLKEMRSTSAEGASLITLEFEPEASIDGVLQVVRDRVSRAEPKLPADTEDTEVREVSFSDVPILILTIAGPVDEEELKRIGEDLQDAIKRIPGVLDADLSGGRERLIRVQASPQRLQHYGLSLDDVIGAIASENVNIPGGDVRSGDASFLLRVPGKFEQPRDIEDVAIKRIGDRPVFVRDVARIEDGFADRASYARMNGEAAVSIAVSKRAGANILQVAEAVKALAIEQGRSWPEGVESRVLGDQSKFIEDMVSELENGVLTALILVVAVILFFMGVRNSLFVAVSIPLSMLLAMVFIAAFGMTLNMIVLFALILALGMLVDNAIVLVENIYRHVEEGQDLRTAAVVGTREVAGAVAASTATTVAAFAPLVFWTGIMGQFMGFLPKTVIIVLLCSLAVAVCVLPALTSLAMKPPTRARDQAVDHPVIRAYRSVLDWSIRHRYVSALAGVLTFVGTIAVYAAFNHGTEFFPDTDPNRATITVRLPDGTDLEATDRAVRAIESALATMENVEVYVAETGVAGGGENPLSGSQSVPHMARLTVDFLPDRNTARPGEKVRVEPTPDTVDRIRAAVQLIAGAEIAVEKERMGPPVGKPIAVEVSGEEFHAVGELAARVRRDLSAIPGVTELTDDYRVGRPEMRLRIDRGAAKRVGASTEKVASTLRTATAGTTASTWRQGDDEFDINVELAPEYRDDLQAILGMRIPGKEDTSPDTYAVPLSTVASYTLGGGSGSIRHVDQKLVVTVEGNVEEGFNENAVRDAVKRHIESKDGELPSGMALRLGGADDEQQRAQEFLSQAFMIAILLIALVLVTQFNRFDLPLVILASVVLSLIGVLWGLLLTGTPFGIMMTGLGVISLAGVVVNNAIVLLDYVEQLRGRGYTTHDALVQAGVTRFRPVMLTAMTTILGLVPMAIGLSVDFFQGKLILGSQSAQWWGPMAVAVIFGLGVATVLTLVMVPTMYGVLEDARLLVQRVPGLRRLVPADPPGMPPVEAGLPRSLEETVAGAAGADDDGDADDVPPGPHPQGEQGVDEGEDPGRVAR
jgi:multidrug efflux pump